MASLDLRIDTARLEAALARAAALPARLRVLLEGVGAEVESQTKQRIATGKTAPDGSRWRPWSPSHARTRRGRHSLLVGDGHLRDSIGWAVAGDSVFVGSNLDYAAIHQLGGQPGMAPGPAAVKPRPYLGLTAVQFDGLRRMAGDWLRAGVLG